MPPAIRLANVTKRYGRQTALDNVSLEVPTGCVFALLGENGAGKTTAIRILLGLLEPDSGVAEVLGIDSRNRRQDILRHVGYVSERPTLYDWMTVAEIGWFTAGFYGGDYARHYERLISDFGLPPKRKIKDLSKGMRSKVALSLSLAHQPQVLLLDEPTSGLDTMVRREFLESMVDLAATGRTVLLSSHQIHEVERVADYVAVLHEGKLVLAERLDDLKDNIRALLVTLDDGVAMPRVTGEILRERRQARQWQVLARGMSDEQLAELRSASMVTDVEVRRPTLEEIFVAYMRTPSANESTHSGSADAIRAGEVFRP
ncbi:MAG TPA: ABC transporter ATP-binding protein [Pirellulales bacterium]|jgi:ABC-2 type transport system ATP-binding protein